MHVQEMSIPQGRHRICDQDCSCSHPGKKAELAFQRVPWSELKAGHTEVQDRYWRNGVSSSLIDFLHMETTLGGTASPPSAGRGIEVFDTSGGTNALICC